MINFESFEDFILNKIDHHFKLYNEDYVELEKNYIIDKEPLAIGSEAYFIKIKIKNRYYKIAWVGFYLYPIEVVPVVENNKTIWKLASLDADIFFHDSKMIIAGGRDFHSYSVLSHIMGRYAHKIDTVVCGSAAGADGLGEKWAQLANKKVIYFPADWDNNGKNAGFIRNAEMGEYADGLIAFWDGKSKGTAHMIKTMKMQHKPFVVFDYNGNEIER